MSRTPLRIALLWAALLWPGLGGGCRMLSLQTAAAPPEPIFVTGTDVEPVWERIIDVLHDYPFEIARENKNDLVIETRYKIGSNLLEPWHRESVGLRNRVESGLQTIRRKVFVALARNEGGFAITVRADKEIANSPGPSQNTTGGATFQDNRPLQRDVNAVVDATSLPEGWTSRGRDYALEQDLAGRIRAAFGQP